MEGSPASAPHPTPSTPNTYNRRPGGRPRRWSAASAIGPLEPAESAGLRAGCLAGVDRSLTEELRAVRQKFRDLPIEGLIFRISQPADLDRIPEIRAAVRPFADFCAWDLAASPSAMPNKPTGCVCKRHPCLLLS